MPHEKRPLRCATRCTDIRDTTLLCRQRSGRWHARHTKSGGFSRQRRPVARPRGAHNRRNEDDAHAPMRSDTIAQRDSDATRVVRRMARKCQSGYVTRAQMLNTGGARRRHGTRRCPAELQRNSARRAREKPQRHDRKTKLARAQPPQQNGRQQRRRPAEVIEQAVVCTLATHMARRRRQARQKRPNKRKKNSLLQQN